VSWDRENQEEKMKEYSNSQISNIIDEYIHNALYRDILKSRYIDGLTYEAIAEKYDRTSRQVKNIIYKHENIIFDKMH
jgi:DNA-directed RNA polymerase specialized sigma24 family protein